MMPKCETWANDRRPFDMLSHAHCNYARPVVQNVCSRYKFGRRQWERSNFEMQTQAAAVDTTECDVEKNPVRNNSNTIQE